MDAEPTHDRALVGAVVRREITRQYASISAFTRAHPGVSRKSLERIMGGTDKAPERLDYVEGALGLPRDTLRTIEVHDFGSLQDLGVEPDLVRWVVSRVKTAHGNTSGTVGVV